MSVISTQVQLAAHPHGVPTPADFRIGEAAVPEPAEGQVLLRVLWASADPYFRGRLNPPPAGGRGTAPSLAVGEVIRGGSSPDAVAEVVASRHPDFQPGDVALSHAGWQTHAVEDGAALRKLDHTVAPVSTALGVLGMPGFTAYAGLKKIGQPEPGETVVVSSAAGAVGALVGQIAQILGARAVGIAGGAAKTAHVALDLGFAAAVDYHAPDFARRLAEAAPDGVDVYWENVGGTVSETVFPLLNTYARIPVCGLIAYYNDTVDNNTAPRGDLAAALRVLHRQRVLLRGFNQAEYQDELYEQFLTEVSGWLRDGRLTYREDVVQGLANLPEAFIEQFTGKSLGKVVAKVA